MYLRMEKILVVVENLTETMEAYEAYGFGPFTEIEEREGLYRKACFTQNTDGSDVVFEIIQMCIRDRSLRHQGKDHFGIKA